MRSCIIACMLMPLLQAMNYEGLTQDFSQVLPVELSVAIIDHLAVTTLQDYAALLSLSVVSTSFLQIVEPIAQKKWLLLNTTLLNDNCYQALDTILQSNIPKHHRRMVHAIILNGVIENTRTDKNFYSQKRINFFNNIVENIKILPILKHCRSIIHRENSTFVENLFFCPVTNVLSDDKQELICQLEQHNYSIFTLLLDFVMHFNQHNNYFTNDKVLIIYKLLSYAIQTYDIKAFNSVYAHAHNIFSKQAIANSYKINFITDLLEQLLKTPNSVLFNFLIKQLRHCYWEYDTSSLLCL